MSFEKEIVLKYRIDRASETIEEAKILAETGHWNTSVSWLYYACFYAVIALLFKHGFHSKSHSGVRTLFSNEFVKTLKVEKRFGILYGQLFNKRQEGDYEDIVKFTKEEIEPLIAAAEEFISEIRKMI